MWGGFRCSSPLRGGARQRDKLNRESTVLHSHSRAHGERQKRERERTSAHSSALFYLKSSGFEPVPLCDLSSNQFAFFPRAKKCDCKPCAFESLPHTALCLSLPLFLYLLRGAFEMFKRSKSEVLVDDETSEGEEDAPWHRERADKVSSRMEWIKQKTCI